MTHSDDKKYMTLILPMVVYSVLYEEWNCSSVDSSVDPLHKRSHRSSGGQNINIYLHNFSSNVHFDKMLK